MAQSEAVWDAKNAGEKPNLKWEISNHAPSYKYGGRRCNVCSSKKFAIIQANENIALNRKSESTAMFQHKEKFKLRNFSFV